MRSIALLLAALPLLMAPSGLGAQEKPHARLCLVEVIDEPGGMPINVGSTLSPQATHAFPVAPYFVARSEGALWTIDAEWRRRWLSYWHEGEAEHHIARDVGNGSVLVARYGLYSVRADGQLEVVAGNDLATRRIRALIASESMGATYALTEQGVYRYRADTGAVLVETTRRLETRHQATAAELPKLKRLAFAYDSGLYLLDARENVVQAPGVDNPPDNAISHILENADGTGVIVIHRHTAEAVLVSSNGGLSKRPVLELARHSRVDADWSGAIAAFAVLGEPWGSAMREFVERTEHRQRWVGEQTVEHPTAGLAMVLRHFPNATSVEGEPGWTDIRGIERLARRPVDAMIVVPHLEGILVGAGHKLFALLDDARPSGAVCRRPERIAEVTTNFCARPVSNERMINPAHGSDGGSTMTGNGLRDLVALPRQWAKSIGRHDHFAIMPWRNEVLGIHNSDVEILSPDGGRRAVRNRPTSVGRDGVRYDLVAVAPELELVLVKADDKLLALLGRDDAWTPIAFGTGVRPDQVATLGRDILISATIMPGESAPWIQDRVAPPLEELLFRIDNRGRLARIPLPTDSGVFRRVATIDGMQPWPSRGGIVVSVNQRPYLWSNGWLVGIAIDGQSRLMLHPHSVVFLDRGADRPAIISDLKGIWSLDLARGAIRIWQPPELADWAPMAIDIDPFADGVLFAHSGQLARLDERGGVAPVTAVPPDTLGGMRPIVSAPLVSAVFVQTAYGWRVLEEDGVLRRIAGLPNSGIRALHSFPREGRMLAVGLSTFEIFQRAPSDPPCEQ